MLGLDCMGGLGVLVMISKDVRAALLWRGVRELWMVFRGL